MAIQGSDIHIRGGLMNKEQAGKVEITGPATHAGKYKSVTTIRARVFSGPNGTGELIEDLGVIAGPRTDKEAVETEKKLRRLKTRVEKNKGKVRKHGRRSKANG